MSVLEKLRDKKRFLTRLVIILSLILTTLIIVLLVLFRVNAPENAPQETTAAPSTAPTLATNPFSAADFALKDGYMTCLTDDWTSGIDVAEFQGEIDWQQVKQAGFDFVFIRVGGRGWGEEGKLYSDTMAQKYYKDAKAAGLKVGAYFFSQATTPEEAKQEAAYALKETAHWELDLPIAYDWEYISEDARTANMDSRTLTDCIIAFCETVKAGNRQPLLYTNPSQAGVGVYLEELEQYGTWIALYSEEMTYPYPFDFWQYTKEGSVPGINTVVDINLALT